MIYGNYAKQYASNSNMGGGRVISESDSIINYLIKEQDTYNNLLLNESYMDDNERLVMEAKIEVLQEAISGAIIAAIVAIIGAIIALIAKFISMLKKGGSKLKEELNKKKGKPRKELTKEEEEKLNEEIKHIIETTFGKEYIDKLMNFCDGSISGMEYDDTYDDIIKSMIIMKDGISDVNSAAKNYSNVTKLRIIINGILEETKNYIKDELDLNDAIDIVIDEFWVKGSINGGPSKAIEHVDKFISSNCYALIMKRLKDVTNRIDDVKNFINNEGEDTLNLLDPKNNNNDKDYSELYSNFNEILKTFRSTAYSLENTFNASIKIERFRMMYAKKVLEYY